jgi:hypothetical protein
MERRRSIEGVSEYPRVGVGRIGGQCAFELVSGRAGVSRPVAVRPADTADASDLAAVRRERDHDGPRHVTDREIADGSEAASIGDDLTTVEADVREPRTTGRRNRI